MDDIDIAKLSDFDFELLCEDLFGEILGVRLEVFSPGPDRGIDLRHMSDGSKLIVQCKHWHRSGRAALVRHMIKTEAKKVRRLKPSRYILATSASLNVNAKEKLVQELSPYLAEADIYGIDELVAELRRRPRLVSRHIRLWLSGASILQALLNKGTLTRSSRLRRNLQRTLEVYAPNAGFIDAKSMLESRYTCVISGMPGIGKTTLARVLCANYVREGYDLYDISEDVDEVNEVWDDDARQVFFYDDFLGQTAFGDKLGKNEDARLIDLLKDVGRSENKRIILTTRGYILEQARQAHERLERFDFGTNTYVLDLEDYRDNARAAILYNNVYFSSLTDECKAAFASSDVYLPVIRHSNYNPRLIENTIDLAVRDALGPLDTVGLLRRNLSNPGEVWRPVFRNQLSVASIEVLESLLFLGDGISIGDLSHAWQAYSRSPAHEVNGSTLDAAIDILDQTMIQAYGADRSHIYFSSASVADYLKIHIENAPGTYARVIRTAQFFEQIERAWVFTQESLAMRRFFPERTGDFCNAVRRTFHAKPLGGRKMEVIHRVNVTLAIAQALGSADMLGLAIDALDETDLTIAIVNIDEIIELTLRCKSSGSDRLQRTASLLAAQVIAEVTEDMSDWSSAERAVEVLSQLSSFTDYEVIESAEIAKEDAARSAIDAMGSSGLGRSRSFSRQQLADILEYADQYDDPTGFSPYAEDLRESMIIIDAEDQREAEWVDAIMGYDTMGDIDKMFSLLRQSRR